MADYPLILRRDDFELMQDGLDTNGDLEVSRDDFAPEQDLNEAIRTAAAEIFNGFTDQPEFMSADDITQVNGKVFSFKHFLTWQEYFTKNPEATEYLMNDWGDAWQNDIRSKRDTDVSVVVEENDRHSQKYTPIPEDEDPYARITCDENYAPEINEASDQPQENVGDTCDVNSRHENIGDIIDDSNDRLLADTALAVELINDPETYDAATAQLRTWEMQWSEYFAAHPYPGKKAAINNILKHCEGIFWQAAGHDAQSFFDNLGDADLERIYVLSVFADFKKENGFEYKANALFSHVIMDKRGDCNTLSQFAAHLLASVDADFMRAMNVPGHATLVYRTEMGSDIYFDVADTIMPPGFFDLPISYRTSPVIIGSEIAQNTAVLTGINYQESIGNGNLVDSQSYSALVGALEYAVTLFEMEQSSRILSHCASIAALLSQHPDTPENRRADYVQKARTYADQALTANANDPATSLINAQVLVAEKKYVEAARAYLATFKLKPFNPEFDAGFQQLQTWAINNTNPDADYALTATNYITWIFACNQSPHTMAAPTFHYLSYLDSYLQRIIPKHPYVLDLKSLRADILTDMGDILSLNMQNREARNYYIKASREAPENSDILSRLASDAALAGNEVEQEEYLRTALENDPQNVTLLA